MPYDITPSMAGGTSPNLPPGWENDPNWVGSKSAAAHQTMEFEFGKASDDIRDVAKFKNELGLQQGEGTIAKLKVGGKEFYGINAHGQEVGLRVNPISRTHAEADVFNQAMKSGIKGGNARLVVDRELCIPCQNLGAVKSMAKQLGISQLEVITPKGMFIITP
jgi:hypothetical protein